MKSTKGFTLVELVIVIVIVGILSVVAVPVYKGYTKKAMATEGKALLGAINTSQKVYYAEFGAFLAPEQAGALDVDATTNKYFRAFTLGTPSTTGFTATTTGASGTGASGISLTLTGSTTAGSAIIESGL